MPIWKGFNLVVSKYWQLRLTLLKESENSDKCHTGGTTSTDSTKMAEVDHKKGSEVAMTCHTEIDPPKGIWSYVKSVSTSCKKTGYAVHTNTVDHEKILEKLVFHFWNPVHL